ncbi:hypothetical protein OGAPHI_000609 [Ogataea philodendri]|uniref:GP-PDE domain-containing protein n=1 Tax=Ogataea philodendri TaxID=1378263 RepID=A0A9P8PEQ5_9ASCO|nr:uncharacterized protein OGAPHI_000609 [Ogataea philodendri]KAH3670898.1 hypothetical protein OGAPHI_000609 [Ogataea philodendri]
MSSDIFVRSGSIGESQLGTANKRSRKDKFKPKSRNSSRSSFGLEYGDYLESVHKNSFWKQVGRWRRHKYVKIAIPFLYLVTFILVLQNFNTESDEGADVGHRSGSWSLPTVHDYFTKKSAKPDAKNELLEENKGSENKLLDFKYTADVAVLPNSPYKHARETSDIRATRTIYYEAIRQHLEQLQDNPKAALPEFDFHWKDWIDMQDLIPLLEQKPSCFVAGVLGSNVRTPWPGCVDLNNKEEGELNFYFEGPAVDYESEYRLSLRGKTYLFASAPPPNKLIFLAGDLAFMVKVAAKRDIVKSGMLESYIKSQMVRHDLTYQEVVSSPVSSFDTLAEISRILGRDFVDASSMGANKTELKINQFEFPPNKKRSKAAAAAFTAQQNHYHNVLLREKEGAVGEKKYDWRFFSNLILQETDKRSNWHQLIRGWLHFSANLGINSWLSLEALLGWHRNGLLSPWEESVHFEVPASDMVKLAESFNGSLVIQDAADGTGVFYIDVNPYYMERTRDNNGNASPESVDLRFIDVRTGLYLEVNGLAVSKDGLSIPSNVMEMFTNEGDVLSDLKPDRTVDGSKRKIVNSGTGVFYHIGQLSPLRRTLFEGRLANVPNRFVSILDMFYKDIINIREFYGHKFVDHLRLWVDSEKCQYVPSEDIELFKKGGSNFFGACHDFNIWREYNSTKSATLFKLLEAENDYNMVLSSIDELPSLYDDYWVNKREKMLNALVCVTDAILTGRYKGISPENTIVAFNEAVKNGCTVVETDLHIASDGEVVICHDIDTNRVFGENYVVTEVPYAGVLSKLRTLQAPHLPMPTLKEALEWCYETNKDRTVPVKLMLDIKFDNDPVRIVDLLLENLEKVGGLAYWEDKIIYGLWGSSHYDPRIAKFEVINISVDIEMSKKIVLDVKQKGGHIDGISLIFLANGVSSMVQEIVHLCQTEKIRLWLWTVNTREVVEYSLETYKPYKVDGQPLLKGFITDDPVALLTTKKVSISLGFKVRMFFQKGIYLTVLFFVRRNFGVAPIVKVLKTVGFI